ncbi:MAG: YbhB/YbcL family Raf kinase inhibitor-like protein [Nanoarchaeota archaeon]
MKIISPAFTHGEEMPTKYTVEGENISPPLIISEVPQGAASLLLIVYDPDIPKYVKERFSIKEWTHWVLFNIDPKTMEIPEGIEPHSHLANQGMNTNGKAGWGGPNPPDGRHRYAFRLYALNKKILMNDGATREGIEKAMASSVIAQTEMMGTYEKRNK